MRRGKWGNALFDCFLLDLGVGAGGEEVDDVGDLSLWVFHRERECRGCKDPE